MIVKLLRDDGALVSWPYQRAEALLRGEAQMKHGVWSLPKDSPYEFINNGFITREDKRTTTRATKKESAGSGNKTRVEAEVPRRDIIEDCRPSDSV